MVSIMSATRRRISGAPGLARGRQLPQQDRVAHARDFQDGHASSLDADCPGYVSHRPMLGKSPTGKNQGSCHKISRH